MTTVTLSLMLALYIIAFVCFVLAAFGLASRVNLIAAGLAAYALTWILRGS